MRASPQEIASRNSSSEISEWIRTEPDVRRIQDLVHIISIRSHSSEYSLAQTAIGILLAESAERSSQRLEKQTDTLIQLTRRLYWLTGLLVFIGIFDVIDVVPKLIEYFHQTH